MEAEAGKEAPKILVVCKEARISIILYHTVGPALCMAMSAESIGSRAWIAFVMTVQLRVCMLERKLSPALTGEPG
jgi:hypothetical protein